MLELWYFLAAGMIAAWAILDGFDLGAGILSRVVAQTDTERRGVLAAIGPYWDGNEVCLIASGGTLLLAFPKAMTAGFSGFYLPMFLLVWSLLGRGLSIEVRSHLQDPLWRAFWDRIFQVSSALLPFVTGLLLGNLLRGVPLSEEGYFSLPLFGSFLPGGALGVLDWYTVLVALFVSVSVTAHGAMFLRWKLRGEVQERSARLALRLWLAALVLWIGVVFATGAVTPWLSSFATRPIAWLALSVALGGLAAVGVSLRTGREFLGFLGGAAFFLGLLVTAAASAFPVLLRSHQGSGPSLDIHNSGSQIAGLSTALHWWIPAFFIACGYFVYVFRSFRGKTEAAPEGQGY
jgi:cytochrome d ubiquinol oxidase subunit II